MDEGTQQLLGNIEELDGELRDVKAWDSGLLIKVVNRLASFSDCTQCSDYLQSLSEHVRDLGDRSQASLEQHKQVVQEIIAHLKKEHGLVESANYTSLYMVLGMNFGLVFGLTVFDNLALGLSLGMCIGIGLGAAMDADIKKKGKII